MTLRLAQTDGTPPLAPLAPPPAPRGTQWISLEEAARRARKDPGYLRRRCGEVWMAAGLARMERREGDAKSKWYVREDASPELARVKGPEQIGADLSHLTDAQRRDAQARKAMLDGWETALSARLALGLTEAKATEQYLLILEARGGKPVSRATLYNWRSRYRQGGLVALADGRASSPANAGDTSSLADQVYERTKALWLTPRKWSIRRCYDLAMSELLQQGVIASYEDVDGGSYHSIYRRLQQIPAGTVTLKREGAEAYTNKHEPYIERDYTALDSNSIWCGDHHRFDVMVAVPDGKGGTRHVRPWLTAWQDLRSRRIVGYHLGAGDPNTDTILRAFRSAALEHGVPAEVQIDNGKDYDARALQGMTKAQRRAGGVSDSAARLAGVFPILGVGVRHVQPYHGQSKPIERFFGTLADRFSRLFETYTGNSPANKPEDLEAQLARGAAPTLEDFARDFADWLRDDYDLRSHTGDGMDGRSPAEVFGACLVTKRAATADQLMFACMPRVGPVRVGQHGVTYQGMHFGAYSPEVAGLFGQRVMLAVDLDDLSRVVLVSEAGRMLCVAAANERLAFNANSEDLRIALSEKRKTKRIASEYHQRRTRMTDDTRDAVLRAARERAETEAAAATPSDLPPPSVAPVQTPFDHQLADLKRLRPASGQEGLARDTDGLGGFPAADGGGRGIRFGAATPTNEDDTVSFRDLAARRGGTDE